MRWIIVFVVAACGVRTPAPLDVAAMIRRSGEVDARRELAIRVLAHPRDVQARLALAELADKTGRPSEAIEQLDAVVRLGGPIGIRWHASDRARLARLLLARGRVRLARNAPTALADLERAGSLGAPPSADELISGKLAVALAELRHVNAKERAKGRKTLASYAKTGPAGTDEASWLGAKPSATPAERGGFGAWLWTIGARRAAYEELAAWHDATPPPRDEALQSAYLRALAWWSPLWLGEVPPPPADELVGPERCWFPGADCSPPPIDDAPLPPSIPLDVPARASGAARYAATRTTGDVVAVGKIAAAFLRDGGIADRLARDFVATAVDAAAAHATIGALFDALGDPSRARHAWQAAVDSSPELAFQRGLAEATGRAGDGPAALVYATTAAAASGDPANVWVPVAEALVEAGQPVDALTAARSALELAGPELLPAALDAAIDASRALGRASQADAMLVQRAQLAPRKKTDDTEVRAALLAHRQSPTAGTAARLWVASRSNLRDVAVRATLLRALDLDDPRRATIVGELLELAGDPDFSRALTAAGALREP